MISLWVLAALTAHAGAAPGLAGFTFLWGLVVPVVGMLQDRLLPDNAHWLIKTLHLLVGLGAINLAEPLTTGVNRTPASLRLPKHRVRTAGADRARRTTDRWSRRSHNARRREPGRGGSSRTVRNTLNLSLRSS